jgi:hypothetical protein
MKGTNTMRRFGTSILGLLGAVAVTAAPADVRADTFPATAGHAFLPTEQVCFQGSDFSGRVTNFGCGGAIRFVVPVVLRSTSTTTFRASAVGAGGAPTCRFAVRSATDSQLSLGGSVGVSVDTFLGSSGSLTTSSTALVQCNLTQNGGALASVRWHQ